MAAAAPAIAGDGGPVTRRWIEQRWLLDNVIRANGIDWDQPRSQLYNAPCGPEANADFASIRSRVQKFADIAHLLVLHTLNEIASPAHSIIFE